MKATRLLLLACIAIFFVSQSNGQSGIVVPPWRMYEGEVIKLDKKSVARGDTNAYKFMNIPASADKGWKSAEYGDDGEVKFSRKSKIPSCGDYIQPTYFETIVTIPPGTKVNTFAVSYIRADDGARIYVNGNYDPKADLRFGQSKIGDINFSRFVVPGKNRVVIAQFDDCPVLNNVHGIDIKVNGDEVTPKVLPDKFRLHAYSINGKRVEKGSNYWMGFNPNEQGAKKTGRILDANSGTLMDFERVDLNKDESIIAFKVPNANNMFLDVSNDKTVGMAPASTTTKQQQFYIRHPEEKEAADKNYVSFESVAYPGHFLRHEGFILKVTKPSAEERRDNPVYRQDASWLFESVK